MKKPMPNIADPVTSQSRHPLAKRMPEMKWSLVLIALLLLGGVRQVGGFILGPAFIYHGRLQIEGAPVSGSYDLTFALYTNGTGGTAVAGPLTNSATSVNNGVFTARLDFGAGVFDGTAYWLEIGVRTNAGGTGDFTILSPRHELTATPYAVYAENARAGGLTGTIPAAVLKGTYGGSVNFTNPANTFVGDGSALAGVNALTLGGLASSSFWSTTGNTGTSGANFLGTTDSEPLSLRAGNQTGFQIQYWSSGSIITTPRNSGINLIGGFWGNTISNNAAGATIAGGGYVASGLSGIPPLPYSSSYPNTVTGDFGTVGGGWGNTAGPAATVPGGTGNLAGGAGSFAAGQNAQTGRKGAFLWSDGTQNPFNGAELDNAFSVLASGGVFLFNGANGLHIDGLGNNDGALDFGLRFGGAVGSGEGIASKRTAGGNQYGLDFYTASNNRMSIDSNGKVGINTTTPSQRLEVNGNYVLIDGANAADGTSGQIQAYIGGNGSGNDVQVGSMNAAITAVGFWNAAASAWMHIACSSITIHGGADLAEPFAMAEQGRDIPQGAVVVIDDKHPGQLRMSDQPYDSRVAGVVSGANGIHPGIQLQQQGALDEGKNVALSGRVYVQADTSNGAINPGDLLTTASTPGHAMKATDHLKAPGAILGKAMTGLTDGKGMVLVLVTLQ